jgi:prepilin-type N-terminal cleavage/methylation domain-containing protein
MVKLMRRLRQNESGFTLIELLVVILIIGILAAIAIPVFLNQQKAAMNANNKSDLRQLRSAIDMARIQTGKPLLQITGVTCTGCAFDTGDVDPLTVPKTDARWQKYFTSMQRISDASNIDVTNLLDATGRPYIIDENEGEGGTSCSRDYIASYKMAFTKRPDYENETKMTYVTNLCITRTGGH